MIAIFLQSRQSSTRYPFKIFARFQGKRLFDIIIDRLLVSPLRMPFVLCLPEIERDRWVKDDSFDKVKNVHFGDSVDLASRFITAAEQSETQFIVRLTGDNPFFSYDLIQKVADRLIEGDCDYVTAKADDGANVPYGVGCDGFRVDSLNLFYPNTDANSREHISELFLEYSESRNVILMDPFEAGDIDLRKGLFSIDHPIQLEILNKIMPSIKW